MDWYWNLRLFSDTIDLGSGLMNDKECKRLSTRVCPRSLPDGCAEICMRFDVDDANPIAVVIWEAHWAITDAMNELLDL